MEMKSIKYIIAIISAVILLAACRSDELPDIPFGEVLQISVTTKGFSVAGSESRASDTGYTTTFVNGDQIGITVIKDGTTILANNVPYQYNGSTWSPLNSTDAVHRYPGDITYLVYYPYAAAMDGKTTVADIFAAFTPQFDQSTQAAYTASDLMTGEGTLSAAQLTVTLAHNLALVEVNLPAGASGATLKVNGGGEYSLYNINGTTYRAIVKPIANAALSGTYIILNTAMGWQRDAVTLITGEYARINTINSFYTGNIKVNYTDGSSETVVYEPFTENIPFTPSEKTIANVELLDADNKMYLIGRRASGELNLKIHGTGNLLFRNATSDGYIPVGSYAEFQMINTVPGALGENYKQEADLNLMNIEWTPVGSSNDENFNPFSGKYDGDGYTIANLQINQPDGENIGLFGCIDNAEISQVHIMSGNVTGQIAVGGIVGYVFSGSITASSNAATIEGINMTGGIAGGNFEGIIVACHNTGEVSGVAGAGGVLGSSAGAITACYNTGTVSGDEYLGGIVGVNEVSGIVTACYNTGMILGNDYIGGIAGINLEMIVACYWLENTATTGVNNFSDYQEGIDGVDIDVESFTIPPGFVPDDTTYPEWSINDGSNNGYWKNYTGNGGAPQLWWE
jgi:hypothetical protein